VKAAALSLALLAAAGLAANGRAAPAYVTDELVLGVYAEQSTQGQRLATLHSGASVETLAVSGESTQVRLPDGRTGWVKTSYLTTREPAIVRIKQLQDELDQTRATTPAPAESSVPAAGSPADTTTASMSATVAAPGDSKDTGDGRPFDPRPWLWITTLCIALACGFWLGYAALARRIRAKFGGLKVY
jgi:SH3-like domain-containing protein